jgi:outer membrane immunogenic protein
MGVSMKKMLFGSVALAAMLAGSAMAADMGVPRTFAPPAASWTGFYVGGNVGGVWGNTDPGFIASCGPLEAAATTSGLGIPGNFGTSNGINTCFTSGLD